MNTVSEALILTYKLRKGKGNTFKIDNHEEKPNPGRSNEPVVGIGEPCPRDTKRTDSGKVKTGATKVKPEIYEVDPCSSDSEPEIIFETKSAPKKGKNNVIEVNIDSDSDDSDGEPSSQSHHDDFDSCSDATTTQSSSRSSSVIQLGSSDMEEDCKFAFDNDVEMVDPHPEQLQENPMWETDYSEDNQDEVVCIAENIVSEGNPFHPDSNTLGGQGDGLPTLIDAESVPATAVAAERKRLGNEYFSKGEYQQALKMYTAAIEVMPTEAAYFGNRSACLIMLNKFKDAAQDAKTAISLDPNLKNGYIRLVRSTLALGDTISCEAALNSIVANKNINIDLTDERRKLETLISLKINIKSCEDKKDYRRVLFLTERAKEIATGDVMLKIKKAESLIKLGRVVEAQEQCTEILQCDGMIMEAITLRAYCFYQADNLDKALQYYKQALQLAPDNKVAHTDYKKIKNIKERREDGALKFRQQNWTEAENIYKLCLDLIGADEQGNPTLESKINFNLALVTGKNNAEASLNYANKALNLNPSYVKALLHRAGILMSQEKFDEAVKDYEAAEKLEPGTKDIRKLIDNAKLSAKKAKRKDYYKILGVDKKASQEEIKKAYKKRALVHHPDRHASASETERKDQEKKFKEVLEAYEILLDDKKRRRYDLGLDLNDQGSPNGYETFDPSAMFGHMFFQQPGMGGMGGRPGGFYQFRTSPGYSGFRR